MVAGVFSIPLGITGGAANSHTEDGVLGKRMPLRSYIGGAENYLLRTVAEAVLGGSLSCERQSFYPLVLYGPTGTGKSHLVRGLLARWEVAHPEERLPVPARIVPSYPGYLWTTLTNWLVDLAHNNCFVQ